MPQKRDILAVVLRWVLGAVFIFSGLVKCVDPVGTSIIVEKYLASYSLFALMPAALGIAITLSVVEVATGVMLVVGECRHWVSLFALCLMNVFLIITLLAATLLPIGDCGCFGEMIKLTPWGSVLKNVVLIVIARVLFLISLERRDDSPKRRAIIVTAVAILLPLAINFVSLRYLPLVDFMPYKEGVDLRDEVAKRSSDDALRSELIFRRLSTGEEVRFPQDAVECWLDEDLEYVDAQVVSTVEVSGGEFADFVVYDSEGGDATQVLLAKPGRVAWLCINDAEALGGERFEGVERLMASYPEQAIVVLVASEEARERVTTTLDVAPYIIDRMTLRSMMRAKVGVVVINSGVIEVKLNILDV